MTEFSRTLSVLVGLPASGKSTWLKANLQDSIRSSVDEFLTTEDIVVLSTDNIVMRMGLDNGLNTYDECWKAYIDVADKQFWTELQKAFEHGANTVIDRTNMSIKSRRRIFELQKASGNQERYLNNAIVFGMDLLAHEWLRRLDSRPGKTIPFKTLQSMAANFDFPTQEEGFFNVNVVPANS